MKRQMMNKVRFDTKDGITKIWLNDMELRGCIHAEFLWDVCEVPVVRLDLLAMDVQVETDRAEVTYETGHTGSDVPGGEKGRAVSEPAGDADRAGDMGSASEQRVDDTG